MIGQCYRPVPHKNNKNNDDNNKTNCFVLEITGNFNPICFELKNT